jgi:hypothetical protein
VGLGDEAQFSRASPHRAQEAFAVNSATATEKKLQFHITYNGVTPAFDYKPHEHTEVLYKDAFREFKVPEAEQPNLALYLPDNTTEVPNDKTTEADAKIQPDTTLILRPRGAGGGNS